MSGAEIRLGRLFDRESRRSFTTTFDHGGSLRVPFESGNGVGVVESIVAGGSDGVPITFEAIKRLGQAKAGDKTMVDTLEPFVVAFGEAANGGASARESWQAALVAAEAGADSTSDMVSARGRASKLGERSRGSRDPGATSMLYVLRAAGEAIPEENS